MGPLLIFAGAAVIAEDCFGFGSPNRASYSGDSGLKDGKKRDALAYEHDARTAALDHFAIVRCSYRLGKLACKP